MNARAGQLVAALRGIASTLPRTNGIGFYVSVAFGLVQIDEMNARADGLVVAVRDIASTLPGAIGIGFHVLGTCDLVQITASTDKHVQVLGHALGLEAAKIRVGKGFAGGRWWFHATWQRERGDVWVDLAGPHHTGTPPERAPCPDVVHAADRDPAARRADGGPRSECDRRGRPPVLHQ